MVEDSGEGAEDVGGAGEERKRLCVRMFPDWAATVLWFNGPVDYEGSGRSTPQVRGLETWERTYYDGLTPGVESRSPALAGTHHAEGDRLAARVAEERLARLVANDDGSTSSGWSACARLSGDTFSVDG